MKAIILAAGEGKRLRPYTGTMPKCMVPFRGKPIIDYILEALRQVSIDDIVIVSGYQKTVLENHLANKKIKFFCNEDYGTTNMVETLFVAEPEMTDDLIICYSDIIFSPRILEAIKSEPADISVCVNQDWHELWKLRMENPIADAETMKIDANNNITELGKRPQSCSDINGQYAGIIKISKNAINDVKAFYHSLDRNIKYDGNSFKKMYMTSFIQSIIDSLAPVKAVFFKGDWLEIDSTDDLLLYEKNIESFNFVKGLG